MICYSIQRGTTPLYCDLMVKGVVLTITLP